MFKLASLFVELTARDDEVKQAFDGVRAEVGKLDLAIATTVGNLASGLIQRATAAVTGFFAAGVKGAADLVETVGRAEEIFGAAGAAIIDRADEMASKFGTVKNDYIDAASTLGAAFKAVGASTDEAARLGNQLAKLGLDMAGFANTSDTQAFGALASALRGQFIPLERFNIMLNAAQVEQEALRLGLIKKKGELDEAAKKHATLSLIMAKSVDIQGDMERTTDATASMYNRLTGTITNLATEFGTALRPAIDAMLRLGNELVDTLMEGWQSLQGQFDALVAAVVSGVDTLGVIWRNLADFWTIYSLTIQEAFHNYVVAPLQVAIPNLITLTTWFANNFVNLMTDAAMAAWTAFQNLGTNLGNLFHAVWEWFQNPAAGLNFEWTPILDGFKATTEQFPELLRGDLISLQDEIDAAAERMAARESDRAQRLFDAANARAEAADGTDFAGGGAVGGEFKHQILGAAEFAAKLRGSIFGEGDTEKKQLEAQERIADATEETADELKKPKLAVLG